MNSEFCLETNGKIVYEEGRLNIKLCKDFCDYYRWFLHRHFWLKTNPCKYDPHITIWIRKIHGDLKNPEAIKGFIGKNVKVKYSPFVIKGGSRQNFTNFYLKCYSDIFLEIEENLNIKNSKNYLGHHITLGNIGKSGRAVEQFQPELITIKCKQHQ
jgi:hypothetical protein